MERGNYDITNPIFISGDIHGDYRVFEHILVDLAQVCHVVKNPSFIDPSLYSKLEYNLDIENNEESDVDTDDNEESEVETDDDDDDDDDDDEIDIYGFRKEEQLCWNEGNSTYVIFVGDIIDSRRERHGEFSTPNDSIDDIYILGTIIRLQQEAIKYGGNILICLGNHEYINFMHFNGIVENDDFIDTYLSDENKDDNRSEYFKFGSEFMVKLSQIIYVFLKINNLLIVHAGFHNSYMVDRDLFDDNVKFRSIIRGSFSTDYESFLSKLDDDNGPIMYQGLGLLRTHLTTDKKCTEIVDVFKRFNIPSNGFLIIGHVVQSLENTLGINSTCNNMIWRIDVGMSKCYDNNLEKVIDYLVESDATIKDKINYIDRFLYSNYERCRAISILSFRYEEDTSLYNNPIIVTQNKMSGQLYSLKEKTPEFRQSASHINGLEHLISNLKEQEFDDKEQILDTLKGSRSKLIGGRIYRDMYKYKYMKYKVKYLNVKYHNKK